jgi:hypothetical protein
MLVTGPDEPESRIRDPRHASVRDEGHRPACLHFADQGGTARLLIVFMQTDHALLNAKMLQEPSGMAGILGRNDIHIAQYLNGPQSDILQIPNRSRDDEKQGDYQPSEIFMVTSTARFWAAMGMA